MKKKILFNIAFVLVAVFCIIFAACFIKSANSQFETVKYYNNLDEEFGISQSTIQQHQRLGIKFSLYATMSLLIVCFMIFMLVYINKNDIKELTVPVVQNVKESRQKKAEEKKQQQIQSLEEKLNQLKKDDK